MPNVSETRLGIDGKLSVEFSGGTSDVVDLTKVPEIISDQSTLSGVDSVYPASSKVGDIAVYGSSAPYIFAKSNGTSWWRDGGLTAWMLSSPVGYSPSRVSVFKTAIAANSAVVTVVGHSIEAGSNQAPTAAGVFRLLKKRIKQAFPAATLTFNNLSIGGTTAAQPLSWTTPTNFTIPTTTNGNYEEAWYGITQSAGKLWMQYAADTSPDLLIFHFDLNDTVSQTLRTNMLSLINDVDTDAKWSAKRPSILIVTSHVGTANSTLIRQNQRVLRGIALEKGIPILDAGKFYDVMTTGYATLDDLATWDIEMFMKPWPAGAPNYGQIPGSGGAFTLDPVYWDAVNCGTSPTGSDMRAVATAAMSFLRKRTTTDGTIQQQFQSFNASNTFSLFYRIDPTDVNYSSTVAGGGTAQGYEVRLSGTTLGLYWRASGSAATLIDSVTLTNGVSNSSTHLVRVEYIGSRHYIEIICNNAGVSSERKILEVFHGGFIGSGYPGVGTTGGTTGRVTVSTVNLKNSSVMEFASVVQVAAPIFKDTELIGTGTPSDFLATFGKIQGNGSNHPTSLGITTAYEPAIGQTLRSLQGMLS